MAGEDSAAHGSGGPTRHGQQQFAGGLQQQTGWSNHAPQAQQPPGVRQQQFGGYTVADLGAAATHAAAASASVAQPKQTRWAAHVPQALPPPGVQQQFGGYSVAGLGAVATDAALASVSAEQERRRQEQEQAVERRSPPPLPARQPSVNAATAASTGSEIGSGGSSGLGFLGTCADTGSGSLSSVYSQGGLGAGLGLGFGNSPDLSSTGTGGFLQRGGAWERSGGGNEVARKPSSMLQAAMSKRWSSGGVVQGTAEPRED